MLVSALLVSYVAARTTTFAWIDSIPRRIYLAWLLGERIHMELTIPRRPKMSNHTGARFLFPFDAMSSAQCPMPRGACVGAACRSTTTVTLSVAFLNIITVGCQYVPPRKIEQAGPQGRLRRPALTVPNGHWSATNVTTSRRAFSNSNRHGSSFVETNLTCWRSSKQELDASIQRSTRDCRLISLRAQMNRCCVY
jgi:hypothetical protein